MVTHPLLDKVKLSNDQSDVCVQNAYSEAQEHHIWHDGVTADLSEAVSEGICCYKHLMNILKETNNTMASPTQLDTWHHQY